MRRKSKGPECKTCRDTGCPDCFVCLTPGCQCARGPVAAPVPTPEPAPGDDEALPEVLRPLTPKELAAHRPIPQEQIDEALAKGRRDRDLAAAASRGRFAPVDGDFTPVEHAVAAALHLLRPGHGGAANRNAARELVRVVREHDGRGGGRA